ncbi:hypothetical protein QYE76_058975 [Lolium multiflorum]|uniref:Protein kinase domain-containing protein n=1 Tax=Lolium multiflorum TaxID=4521 RepID=A0AAD8T6F6_LOLMU|nr:hypothetical protein QYE76_058975 [Lolium multiflorum]
MGSSSMMWMILVLPALLVATMSAPVPETLTLSPGCVNRCGNVSIPYPFGIGKDGGNDCFRKGFKISCINNSVPVMAGTGTSPDIQVLSLSVSPHPVAQVMRPVSWQCFNVTGYVTGSYYGELGLDVEGVYRISSDLNELVILGCNTYVQIMAGAGERHSYMYYTACVAYANDASGPIEGACTGIGCCSVGVPSGITQSILSFETGGYWSHANQTFCPCDYAFIVDRGYYTFKRADLIHTDVNGSLSTTSMPMSLDWAIRDKGSLPWTCAAAASAPEYACKSVHSECVDSKNGPGYICNCTAGYEGNAYVVNGCTDIDECARPEDYSCRGKCKNFDGHYKCDCGTGYKSNDPYKESCTPIIPLPAQISIGIIGGILLLAFIAFIIIVRRERHMRRELYRKNGGPTLEKASIIKLFKKDDLTPILKPSNTIGKGGFGEVYKGLVDGAWVAVKKPVRGNQMESDQFTNEIIIQSKVIHKNIVRLIGCCLEVDTPMLVYEFISQGSMDDILHGGEKKPLSLDARMNIAAEAAQGLAYMHSQANTVILHGDVKPANILLDDKFVPKISDFGISRLIARDNEHTALVIGDMTYMDPVYLQTGLLTAKSDVYSFGVVILELISRKKATHPSNTSLVNSFIENHKKGMKSTELFDPEIAVGADVGLLDSLADLAMKCLDLDVDQRPTMTQIAEQLVAFIRSRQM